jgi:hypothetical protein
VAPERRLAELESLLADVQLDAGKLARFLQRRIEMARATRRERSG